MTDNSDLRDEISAYLGKIRTAILDVMPQKDWDTFKKLKINPKKSYFVKGTKAKLKKFEAYFLFLAAYEKPLYKNYLFEEYAKILTAPANDTEMDEYGIGIDRELIILYIHDVQMGVGNTTGWLTVTVLNKIANRNRQGNTTIVLSERDFVGFQNTPELIYIDLGGATCNAQLSEIAEDIANKNKEKDKVKDTEISSAKVSLNKAQKEASDIAKGMNHHVFEGS